MKLKFDLVLVATVTLAAGAGLVAGCASQKSTISNVPATTAAVAPTMASSEVTATPSAASGQIALKFVSVDSEETQGEDGKGANAIDGNPDSFWHTKWQDDSPPLPHEIVVELVPPTVIKGFTYLPRQDDNQNGTIKDYEFYVSNDGKDFGQPVTKGTFEAGSDQKMVTIAPVKCRYVKLRALSEVNGAAWTSVAELKIIPD